MEYLIQANNLEITVEEVSELITEARNLVLVGTTVNNGKGIDVGYIDKYQVIRLYE